MKLASIAEIDSSAEIKVQSFTIYKMLKQFLFLMALLAVTSGNRCNNKTDVELYDPQDGSIFNCWPAPDCHDGYEPSVQPGSSHPKGTSVECKKCPFESFSNIKTKYRCQKCTVCGNKKVIFTCTPGRDRQCSNSCISSNFYFNKTDQQCHPCSECCGTSSNNIEPQCVSSQENLRIGTVIGEKGALHCKVPSSQQCDELSQEDEVHVTPNSYKPSSSKKKCSRLLDATVIALICCLAVSLAVNLFSMLRLYVRGKQRLCSSHSSPAYFFPSFPCSSTSAGGGSETTPCLPSFEEKLQFIPEDVKIDSIPYEVEDQIKALDANLPHSKNWWDVGRKLEVPTPRLELVKREDAREGGSPTSTLLSILRTRENIVSLRTLVQVLHDLERHDIANPILDFYKTQTSNSDTNV